MQTFLRKLIAGIVAIVFFAQAGGLSGSETSVTVTGTVLRTKSGNVRADVFEESGARKRPVVIVLHGAGGTLLDGPEMRRVARHLAEAGNAVYLLHYFERTGTLFARDAVMQAHFGEWLETVRGSVVAVQEARKDTRPVGIYGYSLGAFLAVLASSDNPRVAAVVEHAGGIWNSKMERVGKMPPVLMIHGRRDARVPFEKYAQPLLTVLRSHSPTVETRFFPDEGHGFTQAAMTDVRDDAVKFFRRYLRHD